MANGVFLTRVHVAPFYSSLRLERNATSKQELPNCLKRGKSFYNSAC